MDSIRLKARAKINLGLDVLGKREDGYHEVRMVMQTIGIYDRLILTKIPEEEIRITSNLAFLPVNENNLIYKAIKLLKDEYHFPGGVSVDLNKFIPVAAGMAGGSTDAAAVLYGINKLWKLGIPMQRLMEYGLQIGADVPFCLLRGTALAEGIGEELTSLPPMPQCYILIAKPPVSVSTKSVYQALDALAQPPHPPIDAQLEDLKAQDLASLAAHMGNVLEDVTIPMHPQIAQIKQLMTDHGATTAMMSGSGPTVFGIFSDKEQAYIAKEQVRGSGLARQVYVTRPFNKETDR